jgi:hypothetical protein
MNPDDTAKESVPEGDQIFGAFVVRINSKKHRNGDTVIIRIGRSIPARKAAQLTKTTLAIDYHDPSVCAQEVAGYLRRKFAEAAINDFSA